MNRIGIQHHAEIQLASPLVAAQISQRYLDYPGDPDEVIVTFLLFMSRTSCQSWLAHPKYHLSQIGCKGNKLLSTKEYAKKYFFTRWQVYSLIRRKLVYYQWLGNKGYKILDEPPYENI